MPGVYLEYIKAGRFVVPVELTFQTETINSPGDIRGLVSTSKWIERHNWKEIKAMLKPAVEACLKYNDTPLETIPKSHHISYGREVSLGYLIVPNKVSTPFLNVLDSKKNCWSDDEDDEDVLLGIAESHRMHDNGPEFTEYIPTTTAIRVCVVRKSVVSIDDARRIRKELGVRSEDVRHYLTTATSSLVNEPGPSSAALENFDSISIPEVVRDKQPPTEQDSLSVRSDPSSDSEVENLPRTFGDPDEIRGATRLYPLVLSRDVDSGDDPDDDLSLPDIEPSPPKRKKAPRRTRKKSTSQSPTKSKRLSHVNTLALSQEGQSTFSEDDAGRKTTKTTKAKRKRTVAIVEPMRTLPNGQMSFEHAIGALGFEKRRKARPGSSHLTDKAHHSGGRSKQTPAIDIIPPDDDRLTITNNPVPIIVATANTVASTSTSSPNTKESEKESATEKKKLKKKKKRREINFDDDPHKWERLTPSPLFDDDDDKMSSSSSDIDDSSLSSDDSDIQMPVLTKMVYSDEEKEASEKPENLAQAVNQSLNVTSNAALQNGNNNNSTNSCNNRDGEKSNEMNDKSKKPGLSTTPSLQKEQSSPSINPKVISNKESKYKQNPLLKKSADINSRQPKSSSTSASDKTIAVASGSKSNLGSEKRKESQVANPATPSSSTSSKALSGDPQQKRNLNMSELTNKFVTAFQLGRDNFSKRKKARREARRAAAAAAAAGLNPTVNKTATPENCGSGSKTSTPTVAAGKLGISTPSTSKVPLPVFHTPNTAIERYAAVIDAVSKNIDLPKKSNSMRTLSSMPDKNATITSSIVPPVPTAAAKKEMYSTPTLVLVGEPTTCKSPERSSNQSPVAKSCSNSSKASVPNSNTSRPQLVLVSPPTQSPPSEMKVTSPMNSPIERKVSSMSTKERNSNKPKKTSTTATQSSKQESNKGNKRSTSAFVAGGSCFTNSHKPRSKSIEKKKVPEKSKATKVTGDAQTQTDDLEVISYIERQTPVTPSITSSRIKISRSCEASSEDELYDFTSQRSRTPGSVSDTSHQQSISMHHPALGSPNADIYEDDGLFSFESPTVPTSLPTPLRNRTISNESLPSFDEEVQLIQENAEKEKNKNLVPGRQDFSDQCDPEPNDAISSLSPQPGCSHWSSSSVEKSLSPPHLPTLMPPPIARPPRTPRKLFDDFLPPPARRGPLACISPDRELGEMSLPQHHHDGEDLDENDMQIGADAAMINNQNQSPPPSSGLSGRIFNMLNQPNIVKEGASLFKKVKKKEISVEDVGRKLKVGETEQDQAKALVPVVQSTPKPPQRKRELSPDICDLVPDKRLRLTVAAQRKSRTDSSEGNSSASRSASLDNDIVENSERALVLRPQSDGGGNANDDTDDSTGTNFLRNFRYGQSYQPLGDEFDLSQRSYCMLNIVPQYETKSRLYKIHSKNIHETTFNQLIEHFKAIKGDLFGIFRGTVKSIRHSTYVSGSDAKSELRELNVMVPFTSDQGSTISTLIYDHLVPDKTMRYDYLDYVNFVLRPEAFIRIYARINKISYLLAETEMRFRACYDGDVLKEIAYPGLD